MNRRERKHMEKELGLQKHYKTLSREKKWEKMRSNQENGRRMMMERKQDIEIVQQKVADQKESNIIEDVAEEIVQKKNIPMIDAMVEAQLKYKI